MVNSNNVFMDMLNTIESKAAESIKANEGDYELDGLLYCGKCNTPKQCVIEMLGKVKKPFCLCKCETERRDREREEFNRRQREIRIANLRKMGFAQSEMANWTFAKDDGKNIKITNAAMKYVEHFSEMREKGKGLLLYGEVGTGKTFYASCIANALIDRGYSCLVTDFARLENTISGMYAGKQEYIDGLNQFSLLVIDDLATERKTDYMNEIVHNIINSRYRAGLPLIITTNLTADEITKPTDVHRQRIFSRIMERCIPVEVKGKDRRREKLKAENHYDKELLGLD